MKDRSDGFYKSLIGLNGTDPEQQEIFDYIRELHIYLWRMINVAVPGCTGELKDYVDPGIEMLENRRDIDFGLVGACKMALADYQNIKNPTPEQEWIKIHLATTIMAAERTEQ